MGKTKPLGLLAVAALGYLAERPMHPYEMYQLALHRQEDRVVKVSPGSLYRAVYGLEADGLVLASGTDIDPKSLRLAGDTITWVQGGQPRSAQLD